MFFCVCVDRIHILVMKSIANIGLFQPCGDIWLDFCVCVFLTFTEHKVAFDVKRLDLDVRHGDGDAFLVVTGNKSKGLLSCAHVGTACWRHQC